VFGDAAFAEGVTAVEYARQVASDACLGVGLLIYNIAENAITQIALYQIVLQVLQRPANLRCLWL